MTQPLPNVQPRGRDRVRRPVGRSRLRGPSRARRLLGALRSRVRLLVRRARAPEGEVVDCHGVPVHCDFRSPSANWYLRPGPNLRLDAELFREILPQATGDVFVDVGAHWGFFARLVADEVGRLGRSATLLAVEADPAHLTSLGRTLEDVPAHVDIHIVHAAIAAEDGHTRLHRGADGSAYSYPSPAGSRPAATVPARSIDGLVAPYEADGRRVALVKIDVDGAEGAALAGARRTLQIHRPVVFAEFSPRHLRAAGTDPCALATELVRDHVVYWVSYTDMNVRRIGVGDVPRLVEETSDRISDLILAPHALRLSALSQPS